MRTRGPSTPRLLRDVQQLLRSGWQGVGGGRDGWHYHQTAGSSAPAALRNDIA